MGPTKILYIGNDLYHVTGYPTTMHSLSQHLIDEGFTVYRTSSKRNKLIRFLDMLWTLITKRNAFEVAIIDTYSTWNFYYAWVCACLLRILNKPYISILHGGNLPQRLKKSPYLCKQLFKNSKINIAPSQYLNKIFNDAGFKTVCIPNTLNLEDYSFKQRPTLAPKLLYVRAFAEIYNPAMAVHVLKSLKQEYPEAQLCMVGPDRDGTLKNVINLIRDLGLEKAVQLTGVLTKSEWHEKSKEYDIFINTSNVDNMPVSIVEAMALGLPVVSTNVGGIGFLIKDRYNGLLVAPNDITGMVKAISELVEQGSGILSINARQKVEQYSWNVVKSKWFEILEK